MIKQIRIRNFRSIKNAEFENVGNTLIFVGENNSGKSTVLNALRLFFDKNNLISELSFNDIQHSSNFFEIILMKNVDEIFYKELEIIMRTKNTQLYKLFLKEFTYNIPNRELYTQIYHNTFKTFIYKEYFGGVNLRTVGLKLYVERNELVRKYSITNSRYRDLTNKQLQLDDPFLDIFFPSIASIDDERKFFEEVDGDAKSISSSVFNLFVTGLSKNNDSNEFDNIENKTANELSITDLNNILNNRLKKESEIFLNRVNSTFNEYSSSELKIDWIFNTKLESKIDFKSHFKNKLDNNLDFMSTGSGTRSIYLISLLQSYMEMSKESKQKSALFLIEEPELYLYPKLENHMSEILSGISQNNQVFMSTHSASLVNNFKQDSIYYTEIKESSTGSISHYSLLQNVNQLMSSLGFNSYPFLDKNKVVIVEGPDDIKKYKLLFSKLEINCDKIAFIQLGGVGNVKFAIDLQFIQLTELKNKFFIIVDSDGRSHEKIMSHFKGVFETISSLRGADLRDLLKNRFYATEMSTMIETLTFSQENMNLEESELEPRMFSYITNNMEKIEISLNKKIDDKKIDNQRKIEVLTILNNGTLSEKISILKQVVLTKKLYKKFINEVIPCKTVNEMSKKEIEENVPILSEKIRLFFS